MDALKSSGRGDWGWLRYVGWGAALALVLLPAVLMAVAPDSGVNWTISDFIFAIVVIGGVGLAFEVAVRASSSLSYRAGAAVGLLAGFLLLWSNAAVGYIGDDNPYNLVFFALVVFAILGAMLARLRAKGMALTMLAVGIGHAVAGAIGYPQDPVTGPITIVFVAMWLTSAALFRRASLETGL
jgi:hypothetical protein